MECCSPTPPPSPGLPISLCSRRLGAANVCVSLCLRIFLSVMGSCHNQNGGGINTPGNSLQPVTLGSWCRNTPATTNPPGAMLLSHVFYRFPHMISPLRAWLLREPFLKGYLFFPVHLLSSPVGSRCSQIDNLLSDAFLTVGFWADPDP